jgi:hypothetical protein
MRLGRIPFRAAHLLASSSAQPTRATQKPLHWLGVPDSWGLDTLARGAHLLDESSSLVPDTAPGP